MGTLDINVHIYPYLKIKMDKKTDTKFIQKLKTHARRKTTFHFRLPQNFFHSPNSLPPNETKNLSLGAKQKRKKKRKRQNLDRTGTRPVRIFMERPCQRRSTIEKFNPQKLNEDPNNGRGPFLLPRNLADSFITRVSTKRVHVNGTGVIKRGGG